jgi:hypothetical protein
MAKKTPNILSKYTALEALAHAIEVYNDQGFIRSGEGYHKYDDEGNSIGFVSDNKSKVISRFEQGVQPSEESAKQAEAIINKFNGKFMLKKMTNELGSFEKNISEAFVNPLNTFSVSVISSIPHMNVIDVKRQEITDIIEELKFKSEFFGQIRERYDIEVEVLDVKFIQSSSVYMITTVYNNKDIIKFWWRDQPDLTDIIDGRKIKIRGTVIRHELSKYTGAHETMFNRVKVIAT